MFDDDDDLPECPPTRGRLWILLTLLGVAVAGASLWWLYRPQPLELPSIVKSHSDRIGRAEVEAKKLPEYAELRRMIKWPLTDAEITRAIELSKHPNAWIRIEARGRLSNVRDGPRRSDAVKAVAAGLREESGLLRAVAMDHLAYMNAREYEAELRAFLASPDETDRSCARHALQQMGLPVE